MPTNRHLAALALLRIPRYPGSHRTGADVDTTQVLKGLLDVAVLAAVAREDGYGYDVVRRLREAGLSDVGDASVYGTLRRLFAAGALTSYVLPSDEGPHRRYYGLTKLGVRSLAASSEDWTRLRITVDRLLADAGLPEGAHR